MPLLLRAGHVQRGAWGGTLTHGAVPGIKVLCAVCCDPLLRPCCLKRERDGRRGSAVLFSEVGKQEERGSDVFQHSNACTALAGAGSQFQLGLQLGF